MSFEFVVYEDDVLLYTVYDNGAVVYTSYGSSRQYSNRVVKDASLSQIEAIVEGCPPESTFTNFEPEPENVAHEGVMKSSSAVSLREIAQHHNEALRAPEMAHDKDEDKHRLHRNSQTTQAIAHKKQMFQNRWTRSSGSLQGSASMMVHTFSNQIELSQKIQEFQACRLDIREDHLYKTLPIIALAMVTSFAIECCLKLWLVFDVMPAYLTLCFLRCANNLSAAMCALLVPGIAAVLVDLDQLVQRRPCARVWICFIFFFMTSLHCMDMPYLGQLGVLLAILNIRSCSFLPAFTTMLIWMFVVGLLHPVARYLSIGLVLTNTGRSFSYHWLCLAGFCALVASLYTAAWRLGLFSGTDNITKGNLSSLSVYRATSVYLFIVGLQFVLASCLLLLRLDNDILDIDVHYRVFAGVSFLLPPVFAKVLGKYRMFLLVSRWFGLMSQENRARDGAHIASMMDSVVIEVGRAWWIHREKDEENHRYEQSDHRHYWKRGKIVDVKDQSFTVVVNGVKKELPLRRQNDSCDDLLALAQKHLRCIEWGQMSVEVLSGQAKTGDGGLTGSTDVPKARQLKENERIDFFVSHSWYDNADLKYQQLERIAADFIVKHGREPTFWLDHVCIDQENILDGLKTLPVNIFSCNRLIALCGPSYLKRLWCAWELCTLLAFDPPEVAKYSVLICAAGEDNLEDVLEDFVEFDILKARCYDPNEQARVESVVKAIGHDHFNRMVQTLGSTQRSELRTLSMSRQLTSKKEQLVSIARSSVEKMTFSSIRSSGPSDSG